MFLIRTITALAFVFASVFSMQAMAEGSAAAADTASTATSATQTGNASEKININTATAEQLEKVKGVGAVKAKDIIEYRTAHGAFKSVNDLAKVKGFSDKIVEKLMAQNPGIMTVE